ncbi:MAG: hypothetical protein AAF368_09965 [Planctomycetota bacterium]
MAGALDGTQVRGDRAVGSATAATGRIGRLGQSPDSGRMDIRDPEGDFGGRDAPPPAEGLLERASVVDGSQEKARGGAGPGRWTRAFTQDRSNRAMGSD